MKRIQILLASILASLFLWGCGPGPKPDYLEGRERAANSVSNFLTALQEKDFDAAKALTAPDPDFIVADLERCYEIFFERQPTGRRVLKTGYEVYHREWEHFVDMQINYGDQVKQIHFVLSSGEIPKVRSISPIIPDSQ